MLPPKKKPSIKGLEEYSWARIGQVLEIPYTLLIWKFQESKRITLPETNIAPENKWLEDYFPLGKAHFQVLC